MTNNIFSVTISIIGYNTKKPLKKLLESINALVLQDNMTVEVVYVDDGSRDGSFQLFQNFHLSYKKIGKKILENSGRSNATSQTIELANNKWVLCVRSNVVLDKRIILEYYYATMNHACVAFAGSIHYASCDKMFENYLKIIYLKLF